MCSHRRPKRPGGALTELVVVTVLILLVFGVLLAALPKAHFARVDRMRADNLRQLVIAAHNCHDTYKKFPPYFGTYPSATKGTPRSLFFHILPFIDGNEIYKKPPAVTPAFEPYRSPLDPTTKDGTNGTEGVTSYLANQRAFCADPAAPALSTYSRMPDSFKAGPSNCVFFVTAVGVPAEPTAHIWTDPMAWFSDKDGITLPLPLPGAPAKPVAQQPYQLTPGGCQVSMGDASTRSVSPTVLPAVWAKVCNPATKVRIPSDWDQ